MGQYICDSNAQLHTGSPVTLSSSSATKIMDARAGRAAVILQNLDGTNDIYWSENPNVTNASGANPGWVIKAGQTPPHTVIDAIHNGAVYAIADAGTPKLAWGEYYPQKI